MAPFISDRERHLRTLCAAAGYRSLRSLAEAAHLSRQSLALCIRGSRTPRPRTIDKLSDALGVAPEIVERLFVAGVR